MFRDEPKLRSDVSDAGTDRATRGLNAAVSIQFLLYNNNERYVFGKRSSNYTSGRKIFTYFIVTAMNMLVNCLVNMLVQNRMRFYYK